MELTKTTFFLGCLIGGMGAAFVPPLVSTTKAETRLLPFQGHLTDAAGTIIPDGAKVVEFKIYDAPTGGNVKWAGEVQKLSVNGGLVNTMLGSKARLGGVDFSTACYLQITIDANNDSQITSADPPLLPRQSVVPAAYAAVSGQMQYIVPASGGASASVASKGWEAVFDNGNPHTGRISAAKLVDASITTEKLAGNSVKSQNIADGGVMSSDLAANSVTFEKRAQRNVVVGIGTKVGDIVRSVPTNNHLTVETNHETMDVPGQKITVMCGGGPVLVTLVGCAPGNSYLGIEGGDGFRTVFSIYRDGQPACNYFLSSKAQANPSGLSDITVPPGSVVLLDTPSAGSHTYELKVHQLTNGKWLVSNVSLMAMEH